MEKIFVGTLDGIYRVVRNGGWKIESKDLAGAEVNALAVSPNKREVVFAGIRGGGVFRSDDSGRNWRRLGKGVLSDKVRALSLDPSNPEVVYVGTEPPALWKSEDGGKTWQEVQGVKTLAEARKWTYPVPTIQPHIRSIAVDPRNSRRMCLAAQVGGVLITEDGGRSWTDVRKYIDMDVHCVTLDPANPDVIYAATGGGENFPDPTPFPKGRPLYRSQDGGRHWECVTADFKRTYAVPVRVHPRDPRTLYLGVAEEPPPKWLNRSTKANGALMRSADGGASWQGLTNGLPQPFLSMVECIELDPDEPDRVFIGTGGEGARFIKLEEGEIFYSEDKGDHWQKVPYKFPIICALAVH